MTTQTVTRRAFFSAGAIPPEPPRRRPPWTSADTFSRCIACGDCIAACPESILRPDNTKRPFVDVSTSGCTFCGDCAEVCSHDVFDLAQAPAWDAKAIIGSSCLLSSGVACRICTDFCETDALRFDMSVRPAGGLRLNLQDCTGCGFCVGSCPTDAMSLTQPNPVN